jgi:hypothetical protein
VAIARRSAQRVHEAGDQLDPIGLPGWCRSCRICAADASSLRRKESVGNIPIETLQRFALLVNMTTAVQLGVYPPLDLIKIAELL